MKILVLPQGKALAYFIERIPGWTDPRRRTYDVEDCLLTVRVVNTTLRDVGSAAYDYSASRTRQRGNKHRNQSGTSGEKATEGQKRKVARITSPSRRRPFELGFHEVSALREHPGTSFFVPDTLEKGRKDST